MTPGLTEAQRTVLLDRAVEAVRARLASGPDSDPADISRRIEIASMAVTDAVTRGGHLHTQIASLVGCTGLRVIDLIDNPKAQSTALRIEENAASNYLNLVRETRRQHVVSRVGAEGYGAVTQVAGDLGVSRVSVTDWVNKAKDEAREATI